MLREIPEDGHLRQQWNTLVEQVEQPQVFYTYEWALAVQRAYSATQRPLLFLAYGPGESLRGIGALAADTSGRHVSFLCATTADYCDFLSLPDERFQFVSEVFAELRRQNIRDIVLANLPADSATSGAIRRAARQHGYYRFARTGYVCAQVSLLSQDRKSRQKPEIPRRKMVRRFLNAMGREAPVHLEHTRSWEALQPALPTFMQTHVARFLVTGRISNLARAERRVFLEELSKLLSESGHLAVSRLMCGETSVAWNYGFQFRGTWFWYQPTFDSDLEKYSPGFCLLSKLIEEAADNPAIDELDLGLGAEEYKDLFANHTRETLYVTVHDSALAHTGEVLRYRAAKIATASPAVEAKMRGIIARLRTLREHFVRQGTLRFLGWLGRRLREFFWSETEVLFYEWGGPAGAPLQGTRVVALDLNRLADAVVQYAEDPSTLTYLVRVARRLRSENAQGFGLVDAAGRFLHFAWTTAFDGFFLSELNAKVDAPAPDSVMLFDCWTPLSQRGKLYYGHTIALIAAETKANGKRPWIFSAATNTASVRGVEKSGFQRRYSLVRKKVFGWQRVLGPRPTHSGVAAEQISARA